MNQVATCKFYRVRCSMSDFQVESIPEDLGRWGKYLLLVLEWTCRVGVRDRDLLTRPSLVTGMLEAIYFEVMRDSAMKQLVLDGHSLEEGEGRIRWVKGESGGSTAALCIYKKRDYCPVGDDSLHACHPLAFSLELNHCSDATEVNSNMLVPTYNGHLEKKFRMYIFKPLGLLHTYTKDNLGTCSNV